MAEYKNDAWHDTCSICGKYGTGKEVNDEWLCFAHYDEYLDKEQAEWEAEQEAKRLTRDFDDDRKYGRYDL